MRVGERLRLLDLLLLDLLLLQLWRWCLCLRRQRCQLRRRWLSSCSSSLLLLLLLLLLLMVGVGELLMVLLHPPQRYCPLGVSRVLTGDEPSAGVQLETKISEASCGCGTNSERRERTRGGRLLLAQHTQAPGRLNRTCKARESESSEAVVEQTPARAKHQPAHHLGLLTRQPTI